MSDRLPWYYDFKIWVDDRFYSKIMKTIITALILLLIVAGVGAPQSTLPVTSPPDLTREELAPLFEGLEREDWNASFQLASQYLEKLKNDDSVTSIGQLRYMLIIAAAGKVYAGSMSYDELDRILQKVRGKKITTPLLLIKSSCAAQGAFNFICSGSPDHDLSITASNHTGSTILAFEYFKLAKAFDIARNNGQVAAVTGVLDRIEPNPNHSNLVILRMYVKVAKVIMRSELEKTEFVTSH